MSKKIVVITGSPRKAGNSFAMTRFFIEAAEKLGHSVTRFDASFMNVGGCHACNSCYKSGKACFFNDDFNAVADAIVEADAVVFTMPVYWYTMPGKIKNVIDRMYSLYCKGNTVGKECALIACCGDEAADVLDGVRLPYEKSVSLMQWKNVGEVLIPGVSALTDLAKTDGCAQAAALAEKI